MDQLITYMMENQQLILALVAGVFVVLTTIMLIIMAASSNATQRQLRILSKHISGGQKPKVVARFSTVEGRIKCLTFENIGGGYAKNLKIELNKEWLEAKERLKDFANNNAVLNNLPNYTFSLSAKESMSYGLYMAVEESFEIDVLKKQPLEAMLTYQDVAGAQYREFFILELLTQEGTIASSQSEMIKVLRESADKLEGIKSPLNKLEPSIKGVEQSISSLSSAFANVEPALRSVTDSVRAMDHKMNDVVTLYKESVELSKKSCEINEAALKEQRKQARPPVKKKAATTSVKAKKTKKSETAK